MALGTKLTNDTAKAACDSVVDRLDLGGAGKIEIWEGTPPANADDAITNGVGGYKLLAELTLANPAFGAAADINPGARAVANPITDDASANASGTPSFFRARNGSGTLVLQGTAGSGGTYDLVLDSSTITAGQTVSINSWTITMPES